MTYGELESRANQLAHYLRSRGAGPEVPVGLCLRRSPDFVVAALAILKCGAAYLPMDPEYPAERLQFMVKDAALSLLVTTSCLAVHFADVGVNIVDVAATQDAVGAQSIAAPGVEVHPQDLAYIIYTSGSTGQPKGVEITQHNLANLISWHLRAFQLDAASRTSFLAGVGFDAAVWEIWPPLMAGAVVYLPDDAIRFSAESLQHWLVRHRITISFVPTVLAEQLISMPWPSETALRFLLTGADTLLRYPPSTLPFSLVNNYGPTECTVVATSAVIPPNENPDHLPSIGRPIDNVDVHIVDEAFRDVAPGVAGEICIGGAGVARGYRNRSKLTAERFISDPSGEDGGRWYRTGDLGRYLPTGEIEFLGRTDDQVKIRGYRIEPNEIHAVLNAHPAIKSSVVVAREDASGEKRLVAYLLPANGCRPDEKSLRDLLRSRLPAYMEPAALVWIDSLPLTANGKLDRAALPVPALSPDPSPDEYLAPRTPIEESIERIIAEVLGRSCVSIDADFFALGAHSLLGAQVVARIRSAHGAELKLLDVFEAPTVAELAVKVEEVLARQLDAMTEEEVAAALAGLHDAADPASQAR